MMTDHPKARIAAAMGLAELSGIVVTDFNRNQNLKVVVCLRKRKSSVAWKIG
jgi:hypothetical protein